jgi:phage terminase large subunit-like protein
MKRDRFKVQKVTVDRAGLEKVVNELDRAGYDLRHIEHCGKAQDGKDNYALICEVRNGE